MTNTPLSEVEAEHKSPYIIVFGKEDGNPVHDVTFPDDKCFRRVQARRLGRFIRRRKEIFPKIVMEHGRGEAMMRYRVTRHGHVPLVEAFCDQGPENNAQRGRNGLTLQNSVVRRSASHSHLDQHDPQDPRIGFPPPHDSTVWRSTQGLFCPTRCL